MVGKSSLAVLAIALLNASVAIAGVASPAEDLRLIKTSENDPGTWMTETEKWEKLQSQGINFVDITETQELEAMRVEIMGAMSKRQDAIPSAPSHQTVAKPLIANLKQANRYYKGSYAATSATWVFDTVKGAASSNPAITVKQFAHSYSQPSVIAAIPGTSGSVVVVTAHFDSIGTTTSGRAPGADDNASVS